MRPPRARDALAALIAAAFASAPVRAQVKTDVGSPGASGVSGVAPIGAPGGAGPAALGPAALGPSALTPSLSAAASAPLAAPARGAALALPAAAAVPSAAAESASPSPAAAAAPAAAAPAGPPNGPAPSAAPPSGPPGDYVGALHRLGVPPELTQKLVSFLDGRHPGDQSAIYHGAGHTAEVAGTAARLVENADLPASRKILLILSAALHDVDPERAPDTAARVSATLAHLDSDPDAKALLADFGGRYGFTADQVKTLIMATDFSMVPAEMAAKQEAFARAAEQAFPGDSFGLVWGRRLAFADQIATYVGDVETARRRVAGLAHEIRAGLAAAGKDGGPADAQMLAGSYKFLSVLKANPDFALLPTDLQRNFDAVLAYFEARQTPEAWSDAAAPAPARAPPASPDLEAARRYILGIAAGLSLNERQTDALLDDFFADNGIKPGSDRAQALRRDLLPRRIAAENEALASVPPALQRRRRILLRLAADFGTTPAAVAAVLERRGVLSPISGLPDAAFELQAGRTLSRDQLEKVVAPYPRDAAGDLMRLVAEQMNTVSGKSAEEIARDGVFIYADFSALSLMRATAGRDPDLRTSQVVFYVTRRDGRWRLDVYRQNRSRRRSDDEYVAALRRWLVAGGIPARDLD